MAEEIKDKILEFLKSHLKEKFAVKHIWEKTHIASLPTIHKWVQVLIAEKEVNVDDYGNIKLIYIN